MAGYVPSNFGELTSNHNKNGNDSNKSFFSRILQKLSSFGMQYDDMVIRQSQAQSSMEVNTPGSSAYLAEYSHRLKALSLELQANAISAFENSYPDKKRAFQEFAAKNEINYFIRIIQDEAIIYNTKGYFCNVNPLPDRYSQNIKDSVVRNFKRLYSKFGFAHNRKMSGIFRKFLVEGWIAFEIVYDSKFRNVIGIIPLNSETITPDITTQEDPISGKKIWIQNATNPQTRQILLDSQIIYISYTSESSTEPMSYVEQLIRPYNLYALIEQTLVTYRVSHGMIYRKYTIPTDGLPPAQAIQSVSEFMRAYEDNILFDRASGNIYVDGNPNIPYSKDIYVPSSNGQSPNVEIIDPGGPNLNETDVIKYFYNKLKQYSRIPMTRLDAEGNAGGGSAYTPIDQILREELLFLNFIRSLQSKIADIILKPLWVQMCLDFPELAEDDEFKTDLSITFAKNNDIEMMREIQMLENRATSIKSMLDLTLKEGDNEFSFFDPEFLIRKFSGLTDEELKQNERIREARKRKLLAQEPLTAGEGGDTGGGEEAGGGSEEGTLGI